MSKFIFNKRDSETSSLFKLFTYRNGIMMIFFEASGRLGNQIFQYAFLKSLRENNEKIIVRDFFEFKEVFDNKDVINLNTKVWYIRKFVKKILSPLVKKLADKNIISRVSVCHENIDGFPRESTEYNRVPGFFKKITFVETAFFQSESFFRSEDVENLKIKDKYLKEACTILDTVPRNTSKVFIHIRRTDYKDHTVYDKGCLLPISYYKKQIRSFDDKKSCFIFLSDDPEFVETEFSDIPNKLISVNNHHAVDLAIMSLCDSAILSPSSFSWWGSYLMKKREDVFAPKYWLGFNHQKDYHSNPLAKYMTAVEIETE